MGVALSSSRIAIDGFDFCVHTNLFSNGFCFWVINLDSKRVHQSSMWDGGRAT
jgi:hypothetical protein